MDSTTDKRMPQLWDADQTDAGQDDTVCMDGPVRLGFEMDGRTIPIAAILPGKPVAGLTKSNKYDPVLTSIREVGVIEPPVVYPLPGRPGQSADAQYMLLDGHVRIEALKELGQSEVFCLISTDDEAYTYNQKVNRLQPIQEHFMIIRALERGVSEERIARALEVNVSLIRKKRDLLRGICDEAVTLLKSTSVPAETLRHLRSVKPSRQVEIVEMMAIVNNYGSAYCQALVAATPRELMAEDEQPKAKLFLSADDVARMQREMETLQRDLQAHEDTYGQNFLNLVIVRGYLTRLLDNGRVVRFLSGNYSDVLNAFQQVVESTSLEG